MAKPTPTTPSEANRIAAAGVELNLDDGGTVRVRFDLDTLYRIEEAHGRSLLPFTEQLQAIQVGALGSATPWIGPLREVLALLAPDVATSAFTDAPHVLAARVFYAWAEAFPALDPKG